MEDENDEQESNEGSHKADAQQNPKHQETNQTPEEGEEECQEDDPEVEVKSKPVKEDAFQQVGKGCVNFCLAAVSC